MEQLIEAGGAQLYIEVADPIGPTTIADPTRALSLSGVRDAITGVASELAAAWDKVRPTEATVEFGIKVVAKTGGLTALVVEGGAEASLLVTLKWCRGDSPGGDANSGAGTAAS